MSEYFFSLLEQLIDAKIAEQAAKDSSDGGLAESIRVSEIRREILKTFERQE